MASFCEILLLKMAWEDRTTTSAPRRVAVSLIRTTNDGIRLHLDLWLPLFMTVFELVHAEQNCLWLKILAHSLTAARFLATRHECLTAGCSWYRSAFM